MNRDDKRFTYLSLVVRLSLGSEMYINSVYMFSVNCDAMSKLKKIYKLVMFIKHWMFRNIQPQSASSLQIYHWSLEIFNGYQGQCEYL